MSCPGDDRRNDEKTSSPAPSARFVVVQVPNSIPDPPASRAEEASGASSGHGVLASQIPRLFRHGQPRDPPHLYRVWKRLGAEAKETITLEKNKGRHLPNEDGFTPQLTVLAEYRSTGSQVHARDVQVEEREITNRADPKAKKDNSYPVFKPTRTSRTSYPKQGIVACST